MVGAEAILLQKEDLGVVDVGSRTLWHKRQNVGEGGSRREASTGSREARQSFKTWCFSDFCQLTSLHHLTAKSPASERQSTYLLPRKHLLGPSILYICRSTRRNHYLPTTANHSLLAACTNCSCAAKCRLSCFLFLLCFPLSLALCSLRHHTAMRLGRSWAVL